MNTGVAARVVWAVTLAAGLFGIVPVVVNLLDRALQAARSIERYSAEIQASTAQIAANTASAAALKDTIAAAAVLTAGAESIERHAAAIEGVLLRGAAQSRPEEGGR